jgi:DNA (cytosine-5)-methyltransferase 1
LRDKVALDLFCGAGGTSTGLLQACEKLGMKIRLTAINHWSVAIATHKKNYPNVKHICSSVEGLDPRAVVPGGVVDLLVASPECRHHSTARGGRPIHDQKRASAWYILRWAELLWVKNILIENVPEFRDWGPVTRGGKRIHAKKGEMYRAFIQALKSLGYTVEERVLNAADYGDATTRRRLFIIAKKGLKRIHWPVRTHTQERWRPAKKVIDWSIPGESIFTRKKQLAKKTIERIAAGLEKFAGPYAEPFLVLLRGTAKARSMGRPVPALTAQGNHVALCKPFLLAHRVFDRDNVDSIDKPMRTLTSTARDWSIAQPFLVNMEHYGGNGKNVRSMKDPLYTISTKPGMSLIQPFLVPNFGERKGQKPRTHSIDNPLPAATSHGAGGLAMPFIITPGGPDLRGGRSVKDPLPTVTCKDRFAVATPFLVNMKGQSKSRSIEKPLPAQTTRKHVYLAEPYMVEVNHGRRGATRPAKSVEKPMPTLTAKNGWALIAPMLVKYYGTGRAHPVTQPVDTITTKDRMGLAVPLAKGEYAIDILFRMLQPHELAAAMSFPKDYEFTGKKEDVVKQIGNAVACRTARALCLAILKDRV